MEKEILVCIHLASGFEEVEALAPADILRRGGVNVLLVSVTGELVVESSRRIKVVADKLFQDIDYTTVDMIILPGGMPGTTNLSQHEGLAAELIKFHSVKKEIAAICAAPTILGELGILKGHKAVCYPGGEEKLGDAEFVNEPVVVSGHIVTSKAAGTSFSFGLCLLEKLKGSAVADKVKSGMFIS